MIIQNSVFSWLEHAYDSTCDHSRTPRTECWSFSCNVVTRWQHFLSWECYLVIIYTIICLKSIAVRKLQVAILAPSPREMSQTERIVWKHILSQVRVSVRPRIFLYAKKRQTRVTRSPTGFSATDRQNGATIWKAVYTFTPGGDLHHNSHKISSTAMEWMILLAPEVHPVTSSRLSSA